MNRTAASNAFGLGILFLVVCASGCASDWTVTAPLNATGLAGSWDMDLSPAQDRSYIKEMVVVLTPGAGNSAPTTFTGSVYGGSPFDNGTVAWSGDRLIFSFVSDEAGQMGGPYYWLGSEAADHALAGRVRSLTRNFDLGWSARRK